MCSVGYRNDTVIESLGAGGGRGRDGHVANWRLRGIVEPGMFPNERAFVVKDQFGNKFVVTVPVALVDDADTVPVRLIHREDNIALVNVLGESASKTLSVKDSELVEV